MKKIFKLLAILFLLSFTVSVQAQEKHDKTGKKEIKKELHLSKQQSQELKTFHKKVKQQKAGIKNNTALNKKQKKARLAELKKDKHDKLEAILTPEQKEKIKQAKENMPRRGVTNMPNERTAK